MAKHEHDDLDIISLFGLSSEEAGGLGLASADPAAHVASQPTAADEPPMDAAAIPVALTLQGLNGAATTSPDEAAHLHDELALLAMLDEVDEVDEVGKASEADEGAGMSRDEHEAPHGFAPAAPVSEARALELHTLDTWSTLESSESSLNQAPARQPELEHGAPEARQDSADDARFVLPDGADDARFVLPDGADDVASLFGLSDEEAVGLGLATPTAPFAPSVPFAPSALSALPAPSEGERPRRDETTMAHEQATGPRPAAAGDDTEIPRLPGAASHDPFAPSAPPGGPVEPIAPGDGSPRTLPSRAAFPTMHLHAIDKAPPPLSAPATAPSPDDGGAYARSLALERDDEDSATDVQAPAPGYIGQNEDNEDGDGPALASGAAPATPETWNTAMPWSDEGHGGAGGQGPDRQVIDPLLLDAFAEESVELLDSLHVELERLESDQSDRGALLETRRAVHTLKGGATMCGFEHVVTLTHSCENLLDLIASGGAALDAPALRALFACEPLLRAAVQDALSGADESALDIDPLQRLAAQFDALCVSAGGSPTATAADDDTGPAQGVRDDLKPPALDWGENAARSARAPTTPGHDGFSLAADGASPDEDDAASAPALATPDGITRAGDEPLNGAVATGSPAPTAIRASGRRSANSINVDLAKVDAVVAKVSEMATHRASYQSMVKQLLETAEEASRNVTRLHTLAVQIGNECADVESVGQPDDSAAGDDELGLESYSAINTLMLQLQEAVSDQQALVQRVHDTITTHWRLRSAESRVDADLQNALMNIRLIPIATMRVRLDGVVRQAAQATGKSVRWQLHGGNVSVEKNVFDRLFEPLMHLLRNAVDHGLELAAARRAAGKPETGTLTVTAGQEDNQIVIAVADDGAGIVPNKIAALAVDRGIVTAEQASAMSYQQKMSLIFTPGFSTASSVSHLSGRGVGMDAVREACLRMGGTIDVSSKPGSGTTFTMRLPLSLSVTRGLIIRDGGRLMAVPVGQISALHLVPAADVVETPDGRVARLEGLDLRVYNLPPLPGSTPASYVQNGEVHVLQVPHEGGAIGLVIEDVLDEEEILIKAPPALLHAVKTILGAYVLPDGTVAPVINLPQLLSNLRPVATLTRPAEEPEEREMTALVVDDSMSMRIALSGTLQSAGFRVLTARDGREALDVLGREGLPRLIMLDIEMPRMDGLETLFAIRQIPGAQELPVFMMTSRGGARHRRAAEQLGATRYFTKPYRDSELTAAAREVCAGAVSA